MTAMERHKPRTYNELIFESFENKLKDSQKKEGGSDVKLERIKEKLWCRPSQLPVHKH